MTTPPTTLGLRHIALQVVNFEKTVDFYAKFLGLVIEWQPDADNVYLTSGTDNIALHRSTEPHAKRKQQHLDHLGFLLKTPEDVDVWHAYCLANQVAITVPLKTHRDGARSFYITDPDGNIIQMIYHPPISNI